jgi:hypothetical protein
MKPPIVIRITARVSLGYSYSKGFVSRLGKAPFEPPVKAKPSQRKITTFLGLKKPSL